MASITSVTLPTNQTYGLQQNLDFTVTFDEAVTITPTGSDSVRIPITLDTGGTVYAVLQGTGASSTTHTFRYAVADGNLDSNGIQLGTTIELTSGATILDAANNNATLTLTGVGDSTGILIDAVPPTITAVTVPANGTYGIGQALSFVVTFSEPVTFEPGTGEIRLPLTLGTGEPVYAVFQGAASTPNSYEFRYTIAEGDLDTDGIQLGTTLDLQGDARIIDAASNTLAAPTLTGVGDTTAVLIDTVPPAITTVTGPAAGTYGVGATLDFVVTFSEPITLTPETGALRLPLTLGTGEPVFAELQGPGTDPNTYVFRYTVAAGDVDTDGIQVGTELSLQSGAIAADAANNNANLTLVGVSDTTGVLIDTIAPTITTVTGPAAGTYGVGATLDFVVTFSEPVTLNSGSGSIRLPLTVGTGEPVFAELQGPGTDPNTYIFRYTVAAGDVDTDGIQLGTDLAIEGDATVVDAANNSATLTLAGASDTTGVLIDTAPPTITAVTGPTAGTYGVGSNLDFVVTFSEPITLTPGSGSIRLPLTVGTGEPVFAELQGPGTDPNTYVFRYTVAAGDVDTDGIQLGTDLAIEGDATVVDAANNSATLTLAGVSDTTGVLIDTTAPTVTSVTGPTAGTYGVGQNLDFVVTFSEAVTLTPGEGSIRLPLTVGTGEPVYAELQGPGPDANSYIFRYTVAEGAVDTDGIQVGTDLDVQGGATVTDAANNNANITLAGVSDTTGVLIDTVAPTITAVTGPAAGSYGVGQNLDFVVTFSEPITLTPGSGLIRLPITVGDGEPVYAELEGAGTEPNSYVFRYVVAAGDVDTDGIQVGTDLAVEGGATVADAANNNAALTLVGVGDTTGVLVDTAAPTITAVTGPTAGTYGVGQNLDFVVAFSEPVTLTANAGSVRLPLTVGTGEPVYAELQGPGTDPNTYVFRYTVAEGDVDTDGIQVGTSLDVQGDATVTDAANNSATLTLAGISDTTGVLIDTTAPTITTVTGPAAGTYGVGQNLEFVVTFSEPVTLTANGGSIRLPLTVGDGEPVYAELQGPGTDPNTYVFRYTVAAGDVDTDGIQVGTNLDVQGDATVTDAANNSATLTLAGVSDTTGVLIDTVAPTITTVTGPAAGTYGVGQNLDFVVTFSEPVTLTPGEGTIRLPLTVGEGEEPVYAELQGPGTDPNTYVFRYTVAAGNVDTDGIQVGTDLAVEGGATVTDAANNTATLTLAGVSDTTGVLIDTVAPTITTVSGPTAGTYGVGQNLDFVVTFSEPVTLTAGEGTIRLPINVGSNTPVFAELQGPGTEPNTYLFRYTVAEGDVDADGIQVGTDLAVEGGATIIDAANNAATLTVAGVSDTTGVLVDTVAPTITAVTVPTAGNYGVGQALEFTVTFDEPVTFNAGTGAIALPITIGTGEPVLAEFQGPGTEPNSYTFRYTVATGDEDTDGIEVGTALQLAGDATISDAANNTATLTLAGVGDATGVLVDTVAPTVTAIALPTNGTYSIGQNLQFSLTFSENITVDTTGGTPNLPLTIGSSTVNAAYVSGTGTNTLLFEYAVADGSEDADGIEIGSSLDLNGATIRDAVGNETTLTLGTIPDTSGVLVDGTPPGVTGVLVPNADTYGVGEVLEFSVTFSEPVTVNGGTPLLPIALGNGANVNAAYAEGSGTNTLVFRYTVAAGDTDSDGITLGDLNLDGATIQNAASSNAILTLVGVGPTTGVLVDGVETSVAFAGVTPAVQDSRQTPATAEVTLTFGEVVTGFDAADLQLTRSNQPVDLTGVTITPSADQTSYTISGLADLTAPAGNYQLRLVAANSGITDAAGSVLTTDASVEWSRGTTARAVRPIDFSGGSLGVTRRGTSGRDNLRGSGLNDNLGGNDGNDSIFGLNGNDILNGNAGFDVVNGANGNDRVSGGDGNDELNGGAGNDRIFGEVANDLINGGTNDDVLVGGLGRDTLIGGGGTDSFNYGSLDERGDTIRGFQVNQDVINLAAIFQGAEYGGETAFAQFNQFVRLVGVGNSTQVRVDANGSGAGNTFTTLLTLENVAVRQVDSDNFVIG